MALRAAFDAAYWCFKFVEISNIEMVMINLAMPIKVSGHALNCVRDFPMDARQAAGRQSSRVQQGQHPNHFKAMPSIGKGVEEIRPWDDSGAARVIYTARRSDAVYVLHAFQKNTPTTSKLDIEKAKARFAQQAKVPL